jgi:uncharacterized protein YjbI with pentapeptide repeats
MANEEHVARLSRARAASWNAWREENPDIRPNLSNAYLSGRDLGGQNLRGAHLYEADLREADLSGANLSEANLYKADLWKADLSEADLSGANLGGGARLWMANLGGANLGGAELYGANLDQANLRGAYLHEASLIKASLKGANLGRANLTKAKLREADLWKANLSEANLTRADLSRANLWQANLNEANLSEAFLDGADLRASLKGANLKGAVLLHAALVDADLTNADLTGCWIYGISAWGLKLEGAKQQNLIITSYGEPKITADNIEVAQFVYLMLNNQKIREVIDTITSKVVLILGRFTADGKAVLDALREELRKRNYLPILFDFDLPATRDISETVSLLARMARFVIADLTDPSSIPKELEAVVPHLAVPVQPLLEGRSRPYAMFKDYWKYEWVLPVYRYEGLEALLTAVAEKVIAPAEAKVKALEERRRMIEAELTKPQ